jgi:hypothetical protein
MPMFSQDETKLVMEVCLYGSDEDFELAWANFVAQVAIRTIALETIAG